jgi:lysophospholipase L1-like esterase
MIENKDKPPETKKIGKAKFVLFCIIPSLLFLVLAETCSRTYIYYLKSKSGGAHYWKRFNRRLDSPAYKDKSWFSKDFLHKSLQRVGLYVPDGANMILMRDTDNPYVTVVDGLRLTTGYKAVSSQSNTPDADPVKLFVIGGSTTFCRSVPNRFTWPSILQKELIERKKTVKVFNLGTISITSTQELERLKFEFGKGNIPDYLVIYNGVNDIYQGIKNKEPRGLMLKGLLKEKRKKKWQWRSGNSLAANPPLMNKTSMFFYRHSVFYSLLFDLLTTPPLLPHISNSEQLNRLAKQTANVYKENILAVHELCRKHDVPLLVFLQPVMYLLERPLLPYEQSIERYWGKTIAVSFRAGYPLLRNAIIELRQEGVHAWDLTNLFDNVKKPVFIDYCHVESRGNALIARSILNRILEVLGSGSV